MQLRSGGLNEDDEEAGRKHGTGSNTEQTEQLVRRRGEVEPHECQVSIQEETDIPNLQGARQVGGSVPA